MRERVREREAEPQAQDYDEGLRREAQVGDRLANGRVVIKGTSKPWRITRQGRGHQLLNDSDEDACIRDWIAFEREITTTADGITDSGKHRHQGGFGLFVLAGNGWIVVDGERYDWETGDFVMLPLKPGGCEHQHFSKPGSKATWLAVHWTPDRDFTGQRRVQVESSNLWKEK